MKLQLFFNLQCLYSINELENAEIQIRKIVSTTALHTNKVCSPEQNSGRRWEKQRKQIPESGGKVE